MYYLKHFNDLLCRQCHQMSYTTRFLSCVMIYPPNIQSHNVINTFYIFSYFTLLCSFFYQTHKCLYFQHKTFLVPHTLVVSFFFHIIKQNFKCFSMNFYWNHKSYFETYLKLKKIFMTFFLLLLFFFIFFCHILST